MRKTLSKLISSSSASPTNAVPSSSASTNISVNTSRNNPKTTNLVPSKVSRTSNMFLQSLNSVIDDFYIVLDFPHKIYRAGSDSMCGLVILIVKKPLNNIYVSLSMNGVVKVNDVGLRGSEKARLFSISVNLYGSPHENNGLSKGEHRFPFKIKLPRKNIYSSLSFEKGSISYSLKSELFLNQELSSVNSIFNPTGNNTNNNNNNENKSISSSFKSSNVSANKSNNKFKSKKIPEKNNRLAKCEKNVKIICPINVERFTNNKPSVLIIKQPPKKFAGNSSTNVSFLSKKSSNSSSNNISNGNIASHSFSNSPNSNTLSFPQLANNPDNNDDSFTVASSSSTTNSLTRTISSSIESSNSLDPNQQSCATIKSALSPHLPEKKIKLTLDSPSIAYLPNDVIPFTVKLQHVNTIKSLDGMIITLIRVCKINSYEKQKQSKLRSFSTSSSNNNNSIASSNSFSSIPGIGNLHQKFKDSSVISDSSLEEEDEAESIQEEIPTNSISAVPSNIPQSIPQSSHESPKCSIRGKIATFRKDIDQVIKPLYVLSANHYTFEVSGNLKLPYDAFPTLRGAPLFSFEYFIEVVINLNNSHQSLIGTSSSNLSSSPVIESDDLGNMGKRRDKVFNIKRFGSSSSNVNGSTSNTHQKGSDAASYKDDRAFANGKCGNYEARQIVNVDKLKTQKNVISLTRRIIVGTERSLSPAKVSKNENENENLEVDNRNTQEELSATSVEISDARERSNTVDQANTPDDSLPIHPPPFQNHELSALPPPIEHSYGVLGMNGTTNTIPISQLPPPLINPPSAIGVHPLNFTLPDISSLEQSDNHLSEKEVLRLQEEALLPSDAPPIFGSSSTPIASIVNNNEDMDNGNLTAESSSSSNELMPTAIIVESAANGAANASSRSNELAELVHSEIIDCVPKYENNE